MTTKTDDEPTALTPADDQGLLVPALATDHPAAAKMMRALRRKTPKALIKTRPGPGGMRFSYVHWSWIVQRLNEVFGPTWGREVTSIDRIDLPDLPPRHDRDCGGKRGNCKVGHRPRKRIEVITRVRITTQWGNKDATGGHTYFPDNAEQGYADAEQAAISKGMKRAASLLGIALDLYTDLPDDTAVEADFALQDAQAAWRSELGAAGLTEKASVSLLSEKMAGDAGALTAINELLDATGEEGAAAYRKLIETLRETVEEVGSAKA